MLPHLDAAYRFARWLAYSPADAEDVVQDALLRAYRGFDALRGSDAKAWLLVVVYQHGAHTINVFSWASGRSEVTDGIRAGPASLRQRDKWQLRSLQARILLERKENHDEEIPPQSLCGI